MGPDDLRQFIRPFALFLVKQTFFDDAVGSFDGPIGLRVVHRGKDYLRAQTVTEFSKEL